MKKNRIKTVAGDRVTVEVSPYGSGKRLTELPPQGERAARAARSPDRNQFRRR